ncbi:MAG: sodium/solute symporter [Planctomycetota bacterium]
MGVVDLLVFVLFIVSVISIGLIKSSGGGEDKGELDAQDYFLAGRGLTWWLVGFSLIAANISTEQFVGMSGKAADWLGMAIASYEWMAAVTLIFVAFVFLPKFLKSGIYTIPEYLEYRYNAFARAIMAVSTLIILVGVPTASVIYAGAKVICVFFQGEVLFGLDLGNIVVGCWIIGVLAAMYVFAGGLKACAWADLVQGAALIVAGGIVTYLAITTLANADPQELVKTSRNPEVTAEQLAGEGGLKRFFSLNTAPVPEGKLHMVRPLDDAEIPWSALLVGLWIPNFFYWGLNQYITQRTLGSKSLAEGQKGIVFAAFLKLLIPFIVVVPGILAYNLYGDQLYEPAKEVAAEASGAPETGNSTDENPPERKRDFDAAFPTLLRNLLPLGVGIRGFVIAAIFGAVVSSLASMLNSASTIFSMDIYNKLKGQASQGELVLVGRVCTVVFVLIALLIAQQLGDVISGIFSYIQEFQGFISPGILGVFLFGLLVPTAPRVAGTIGLVVNPIAYALFKFSPALLGDANPAVLAQVAEWSFLNRMALSFGCVLTALTLVTVLKPLKTPIEMPVNEDMDVSSSPSAKFLGGVVVFLTAVLYWYFW